MKIPILTLPSLLVKICQIPHVIFQTKSQFFFNVCMTPRCRERYCTFFRSNVIYFARNEPIKLEIFENFEYSYQNSTNCCPFRNNIMDFLQILHHSLVSRDITFLYFFSWNFIYFQQKEPIKVQNWWNFTWAVESLEFCTLMGSFCRSHIKFLLKKYRRVICHQTKGYLRYKTITSQNVLLKAQIKNFFISYKNYFPFSRYSRYF